MKVLSRVILTASLCLLLFAATAFSQWTFEELYLAKLYEEIKVLDQQGRYAEGIAVARKFLKITEETYDSDHPNVAVALSWLASFNYEQGKYSEAEPLYQRALRIDEKAYGPDHPDVANDLNNLALLYKTQGKYSEAEPLLQRALRIMEKELDKDHPNMGVRQITAKMHDKRKRWMQLRVEENP